MRSTLDCVTENLIAVFRSKGQAPPPIGPETALDHTLGLESLDYAELVVRLEEDLGVDPFARGAVGGLQTVADLVSLYERSLRTT